jgi:hypothetical protein
MITIEQITAITNHLVNNIYGAVQKHSGESISSELRLRCAQECADYIHAHMERALEFENKEAFWKHALSKISVNGLMTEFGVWHGTSINFFAKSFPSSTIFGFDSFEGLQEDWAGSLGYPKGTFSLEGQLPTVESNVRLIKGWVEDTLPKFLEQNAGPSALIHVDTDTYEAAKTIFTCLDKRIVPGTVIIFDEYFGYRGWKIGEFKAWKEFVALNSVHYEYLGFHVEKVTQVAVLVHHRS